VREKRDVVSSEPMTECRRAEVAVCGAVRVAVCVAECVAKCVAECVAVRACCSVTV